MARSNSLEEYHRRSRAHRFDKWANNNNGSSIAIRSRVVQIPVKHQGAQLTRSTPASNGMTFTERTQGRAHVQTFANRVTWTSLKEDIGCSPAELLFGTTLQVPGEFFVNCKESRREAQKTNVYASSDTIITAYKNRDHSGKRQSQRSCRSSALEPLYRGPYKIIERINDKIFKIQKNYFDTSQHTHRQRRIYKYSIYISRNLATILLVLLVDVGVTNAEALVDALQTSPVYPNNNENGRRLSAVTLWCATRYSSIGRSLSRCLFQSAVCTRN